MNTEIIVTPVTNIQVVTETVSEIQIISVPSASIQVITVGYGGGSGAGSLTLTDGVNTVTGTTQITVSGATVSGSTPNATLAITDGVSSFNTLTGAVTLTAYSEVPSGLVNSSNVTFTLANTPIDNQAVQIALDGLIQYNYSNGLFSGDFSVSGKTITFAVAPSTGGSIYAFYLGLKSSSSINNLGRAVFAQDDISFMTSNRVVGISGFPAANFNMVS